MRFCSTQHQLLRKHKYHLSDASFSPCLRNYVYTYTTNWYADCNPDSAHLKHNTHTNRTPTEEHAYRIFRNWVWEILSIAVAIGLIVAIAVILATHDGKPAPDWGEQINMNALLATLYYPSSHASCRCFPDHLSEKVGVV
jgi:hypothetical protein